METGPNSVLLKKSEESRLDDLFNNFARTVLSIFSLLIYSKIHKTGCKKLEI